MAAHLENHPGVHAVVNLVPILLDQLEDYARAVRQRQSARSAAAAARAREPRRLTPAERELMLTQCFRANHTKMIEPFTPYKRLRDLYRVQSGRIGGEAGALSVRPIPLRPADLVSPVLDRRNRPAQGGSGGAADDPWREISATRDRMSCSSSSAHRSGTSFRATAGWPSPGAWRCRLRRTTIRSARCCSTSPARARPCPRRLCPRPTTTPAAARASSGISKRAAQPSPPLRCRSARGYGRPKVRCPRLFSSCSREHRRRAGPPAARAFW